MVFLKDEDDQSEYEVYLDILEMEAPYFANWENYWEVTMSQNDTNVVYSIPYIFQTDGDIVQVAVI